MNNESSFKTYTLLSMILCDIFCNAIYGVFDYNIHQLTFLIVIENIFNTSYVCI